jgi:hypothetical protein
MKYRKRPEAAIDAWQVGSGEPPQWAREACVYSTTEPGATVCIRSVDTPVGIKAVGVGDWLVRCNFPGAVAVYAPDIFEAAYEPA